MGSGIPFGISGSLVAARHTFICDKLPIIFTMTTITTGAGVVTRTGTGGRVGWNVILKITIVLGSRTAPGL